MKALKTGLWIVLALFVFWFLGNIYFQTIATWPTTN